MIRLNQWHERVGVDDVSARCKNMWNTNEVIVRVKVRAAVLTVLW